MDTSRLSLTDKPQVIRLPVARYMAQAAGTARGTPVGKKLNDTNSLTGGFRQRVRNS